MERSVGDAGHGYWGVRPPDADGFHPQYEPALVVGVEPDFHYESHRITLAPGSRVMVCSDGIVEQPSPSGEQYGRERSLQILKQASSSMEDVELLVQAVLDFAQTEALADDVTVASVEFD